MTVAAVSQCASCTNAGLLVCTCDFYAEWHVAKPQINTWLGREARQFRDGHRAGRVDTLRRVWSHLDTAGRNLAASIAAEGD